MAAMSSPSPVRPFLLAVFGALVALALAALAIAAGLIEVDNTGEDATTTAASRVVSDVRPASAPSGTVGQVYERNAQGVAFIEAERGSGSPAPPGFGPSGDGAATGSGFLFDDQGHLLTNAHVVDGATDVSVKFGDGDELEAEVLGVDDSTDVAVLEVDPSELDATPLALGDTSSVAIGDPAIAIGNPYGLDRTVTAGIVSALQRQINAPNGFTISNVLQTDAAINPGNSGGPLFDASGRVIGINSQIATGGQTSGNVGIGFAVPIETARSAAEQILEGGEVEHAYLGISGADVDEDVARALDLDVTEGALVQEVTPDGPAEEAGIQGAEDAPDADAARLAPGGDVIVAIDGEPVAGMDELIAAIDGYEPGDEVTLEILRDGAEETVEVQLGDRPSSVPG
jgi:S1-C subfamily serine protease